MRILILCTAICLLSLWSQAETTYISPHRPKTSADCLHEPGTERSNCEMKTACFKSQSVYLGTVKATFSLGERPVNYFAVCLLLLFLVLKDKLPFTFFSSLCSVYSPFGKGNQYLLLPSPDTNIQLGTCLLIYFFFKPKTLLHIE